MMTVPRDLAEIRRLPAANTMTPVAIELLLEIYTRGIDSVETDAQHAAVIYLQRQGLVAPKVEGRPDIMVTDKGIAHIEALLKIPLPEARTVWVTPLDKLNERNAA